MWEVDVWEEENNRSASKWDKLVLVFFQNYCLNFFGDSSTLVHIPVSVFIYPELEYIKDPSSGKYLQ